MIRDVIASAHPELVAEAESLMTLTVTVNRFGSTTVMDHATGLETRVRTVVYAGKADIVMSGAQPHLTDAAGQQVPTASPVLKIPLPAPLLLPGDEVIVDGRDQMYSVRDDITRTHAVTRRYQLDT